MQRSTKNAWLEGAGDLAEDDVEDVPVPGQSVRVRALSAKYAAEVQSHFKLVQEGKSGPVAKIDVATMELLQFVHGCVEPQFTMDEGRVIQERYGAAFRKVVARIDELSGIDKEAIEQAEAAFPDGGTPAPRDHVGDGTPAWGAGPDVHVRVGA
jgi:hypothetical protein